MLAQLIEEALSFGEAQISQAVGTVVAGTVSIAAQAGVRLGGDVGDESRHLGGDQDSGKVCSQ